MLATPSIFHAKERISRW